MSSKCKHKENSRNSAIPISLFNVNFYLCGKTSGRTYPEPLDCGKRKTYLLWSWHLPAHITFIIKKFTWKKNSLGNESKNRSSGFKIVWWSVFEWNFTHTKVVWIVILTGWINRLLITEGHASEPEWNRRNGNSCDKAVQCDKFLHLGTHRASKALTLFFFITGWWAHQ